MYHVQWRRGAGAEVVQRSAADEWELLLMNGSGGEVECVGVVLARSCFAQASNNAWRDGQIKLGERPVTTHRTPAPRRSTSKNGFEDATSYQLTSQPMAERNGHDNRLQQAHHL